MAMISISKKLLLCASAIALSAFVGGILTPTTAEAGFGIKVPNIKVPGAKVQKGSNTSNNAAQAPKGNMICGKVSYNNTGNYKPAAGFDVYLLHGNSFPHRDANDPSVLLVDGPHMKIATTDANGNYSAPIPANVNSFATNGKFPDVKLLFFKPGTGNYAEKRSLNYIGKFTETTSISHWEPGGFQYSIRFVD